jgi:hypothetical protein
MGESSRYRLGGAIVFTASCVSARFSATMAEEGLMTRRTPQQILAEHNEEWMSVPGVVGTAIGEHQGGPAMVVLVVEQTERINKAIPSEVDGFPVLIKESGQLHALDMP